MKFLKIGLGGFSKRNKEIQWKINSLKINKWIKKKNNSKKKIFNLKMFPIMPP